MKLTANCLFTDRPNANGIMYDKESLMRAVEEYNNSDKPKLGCMGQPTFTELDFTRVSHKVNEIKVNGDCVTVNLSPFLGLPQQQGELLTELINGGVKLTINPKIIGEVDDNGYAQIKSVIGFDISCPSIEEEVVTDNIIGVVE